jgi:unsaturated rhamnogalacturonyl hydrolase
MQTGNVLRVFALAGHFVATGFAGAGSGNADIQIPSRKETLTIMRRVNAWQSAHPLLPANDRNWERGTWYTGVMAAWKATGDPRFLNQALAWGRQHQWQVETKEPAGADRIFCTQTWVELYFAKKDRSMIEPTIQWLDASEPNSPGGAKRWYMWAGRNYVDALYAAPVFPMLARATGNRRYSDLAHAMFRDISADLFDEQESLYYRDNRFTGEKTPSGKKIIWSRGNGWALGAIVRVLEYLPEDDPERPWYVERLRAMADSLIKRQGGDGLWRPNLGDPDQAPGPETSGSGFFCYGLAWGINHGVLPTEKYLPAVKRAWAGLYRSVSSEGKVLWGQKVADRPDAVAKESTHEYVTGAFLLAGSEMYRLARQR